MEAALNRFWQYDCQSSAIKLKFTNHVFHPVLARSCLVSSLPESMTRLTIYPLRLMFWRSARGKLMIPCFCSFNL